MSAASRTPVTPWAAAAGEELRLPGDCGGGKCTAGRSGRAGYRAEGVVRAAAPRDLRDAIAFHAQAALLAARDARLDQLTSEKSAPWACTGAGSGRSAA